MYLADYHTHTQFSPDAQDSMTAMAQAAIRAGLDEICFTDHVEPMTKSNSGASASSSATCSGDHWASPSSMPSRSWI